MAFCQRSDSSGYHSDNTDTAHSAIRANGDPIQVAFRCRNYPDNSSAIRRAALRATRALTLTAKSQPTAKAWLPIL
jgi:hypothetical protein